VVWCSHNQLSSVPEELVSRLTGLHLLFLENNKLEELPNEVSALSRLELLRVDCNQLRRLPDGMANMSSLIGMLSWQGQHSIQMSSFED
jgi:Leucine-rich repeat (LRR) protein